MPCGDSLLYSLKRESCIERSLGRWGKFLMKMAFPPPSSVLLVRFGRGLDALDEVDLVDDDDEEREEFADELLEPEGP